MDNKESGEEIFRPKARIIRSLGDELISNEFVAINELVKNSYDAGSPSVEIIFEDNKIIIKDYGCGMDYDDFKHSWLEPATNFKKKNKSRANGKQGIVQGEKGIGRFAVTKLAKKLKLITKKKNQPTYEINFDWNNFYEEEKYLDEVKVFWKKKEELNKLFEVGSGTILILENLNVLWDEIKIIELKKFVRRLLNPFEEVNEFEIKLLFGGKEEPLEPSDTLKNPNYSVKGNFISDNKKIKFTYSSKIKNEVIEKEINSSENFECGSFKFEFRIWDLEPDSLRELKEELNKQKIQDIRNDLRAAGGISIYRDNFRILPYGESGNDWLRLDSRRVNNPTMRLSNNQIVGYIGINVEENKELRDQTNRQGLIENNAFDELKEIIFEILENVESRRYKERREKYVESNEEINPSVIFETVDLGDIKEKITKSYPNDKETIKLIDDKEKEVKKQTEKFKTLILRYRRLSTLGQLLDNVIHETSHYFSSFSSNIYLIKKLLKKDDVQKKEIESSLEKIELAKNNMIKFVDKLKPFTGRRRDLPKKIKIKNSIYNIVELKKLELGQNKIQLEIIGENFELEIREIDLNAIITNLIENSIYWLSKNEKDKKILIELNSKRNSISFTDNGPGVPEEYKKMIFDPYFSLKKNGTGIGLSIIGEIVSEYKGYLEFYSEHELGGASFEIRLENE